MMFRIHTEGTAAEGNLKILRSHFTKFAPPNHVVEIGTGEGKSVTLAVSAMLLSLLGFGVDVVCYSDYLSDRDFESFQHMFMKFGLSISIRYGSFKTICEKFLNERGNIRSTRASFLLVTANELIPFVLDIIDDTPSIIFYCSSLL